MLRHRGREYLERALPDRLCKRINEPRADLAHGMTEPISHVDGAPLVYPYAVRLCVREVKVETNIRANGAVLWRHLDDVRVTICCECKVHGHGTRVDNYHQPRGKEKAPSLL